MKKIALSQRVDVITSSKERRDAIDQKHFPLLDKCEVFPVLIPNNLKLAKLILNKEEINGIILSGGNDLVEYGGNAPERDETEKFLLEYAIANKLPVLGICRGMEVIQHYFEIKLKRIPGHVGKKHKISLNGKEKVVNSFHQFVAEEVGNDFELLATSEDSFIEAIKHKKHPITGIMWHPERNNPFSDEDIKLIKEIFSVNSLTLPLKVK